MTQSAGTSATINRAMSPDPDPPEGRGPAPEYRVYGSPQPRSPSRPASPRERPGNGDGSEGAPGYTVYRSRPRGLLARLRGEDDALGGGPGDGGGGDRRGLRRGRSGGSRRITPGRVLKYVVLAILGWILLSVVLFVISAQIEQSKVSDQAKSALASGGFPLTSANTILVLGSDQRAKGSKEPGANPTGPSRSDSILLLRVGGGHGAKLSILRDTVVPIPGHGRAKINAAYAYGGAALSIRTIDQFLGIRINHVVIVSFDKFPDFIDTLGGVDVKTRRICSDINGGTKNGGVSLYLHTGEHHLNGKRALAYARTRHNKCNPRDPRPDLTRAKQQQQILSAMKGQLTSPGTFFRLPWVSWNAPQAIRTDMGGFGLLGLAGAVGTSGSGRTTILEPTGVTTLPDGEAGLTVSDSAKQRAVRRFLKG